MDELDTVAENIRAVLDAKNAARDLALERSRTLIRNCALAIRAAHRQDYEEAANLLVQAKQAAEEMVADLQEHPDLYYAGYTQDALKEYAEASLTYALIRGLTLPTPDELKVEPAAYLNGLAEATGELRRHALDLLRQGQLARAEEILTMMDDIYGVLVTIDYPDAITGGLRRNTDMVRGVLERTRGELTVAVQQTKLTQALEAFEARTSLRDRGQEWSSHGKGE